MHDHSPPGLRALTLHRPWAELVADGWKTTENRRWTTRYRGPFVIHAGQQWAPAGADLAAELGHTYTEDSPTGFLAVAQLVDIHPSGDCRGCDPWGEPNCWHWVLTGACRFPEPVPGSGRRNLYIPPAEVIAAVAALDGQE